MNEPLVRKTFYPYMEDDNLLVLPDGSRVMIAFFAKMFSSVTEPITSEKMHTVDGGTKGYNDFIEQAKADGLIT